MVFAWQAQGFRLAAKYAAGAGVREGCKNVGRRGGFEEGLKRCVRVAGAVTSRFVMSMFEGSDAESVEGLQICCDGSVTLQRSFRVAVTRVHMPWLNFFVASAVLLQHPLKNR